MGFLKDSFKGYDKLKTNTSVTYEELFESMEDGNFPCGKPELIGREIMKYIKFPPVDKYAVQVSVSGKTITVMKTYSGAGGLAKEIAGDTLTKGWFSMLNKENVEQNQATRTVIAEIKRLFTERGLIN